MLEVAHVSKVYTGIPAVDDVSFQIARGEIVGFIGPNGAGKSTTVKIITGMVQPTRGRVLFEGTPVLDDILGFRARLGYVPEEAHLYPHLSGLEHLQLVGRLRGLGERLILKRSTMLLEQLGLDSWRHTPISLYSKGMRQRILLATAILHNPQLIVLDEPLSGLDVVTAQIFRDLLTELAADGKAILYISHVPEIVEKVCDRVLVIAKGRVRADAPPALMVLYLIPSYYGLDPWNIPRTPWLQAQEHFVLITYACTVIGMVAVLTWERFLPTLLEARVLAFLPIRRGQLFLGKVLAMALFFGAFLIGAALPAAVLLVMFANSHHLARHLATHLLAVGLAGYFTATSCLALLSLTALLPWRARRFAGPLLQAGLIAFLLLSLFFSPTVAPSLETLVASQSRLVLWVPAFWFTGIYEFVLHTSPGGQVFAHLAAIATAGTLISSAAFLLLYPLA